MRLMLLLTELVRLDVQLSAEGDRLHVDAPAGVLTDELRQAMVEHKADLLRYARWPYVDTIVDGLGWLTGHYQEQDVSSLSLERRDAFRYKVGVTSLTDGARRFYWPREVWLARSEALPATPEGR